MKLTYRGSAYEVPVLIPFGSDSTNQPKIKLIYRGRTYHTTLCSVVVPKVVKTDGSTVTLMYRGNPYRCKLQSLNPYQKSHAINWYSNS